MERERTRDREAMQKSLYEQAVNYFQDWIKRQETGNLLLRFEDRQYEQSRQGYLKYYLSPLFTETALNTWVCFEHLIKRQTGRHTHQGGIIIYVIEGEGSTEVDGQMLDWKAGDLLLLPIQPGGVTHQHWNKDPSKGCRWIAFRDLLISPYIANVIDQISETPDNQGASLTRGTGKRKFSDWRASVSGDQVSLVTHPDQLASTNMFAKLVEMRDLQDSRREQGTWIIRGDELPWELNPHGKMQWYLHPCIAYTVVQTHIFYRQEIPVGSRSGLQRHGGDIIFKILQGEGYTEVDGVRYNWKKDDVMTLPLLRNGLLYRHVNTGAEPVLFLGMERNLVHTVGVGRHSGFEEVQPCPEYREQQGK